MDASLSTDVVVIGMGPAGEHVAGRLADAGLDVVGVDRRLLGGECPYWGCVPSKMMIRAAHLLAEARRVPGMAGEASVRADWSPVAQRLRAATDGWDDRRAVGRFEDRGGRFLRGEGRIVAPGVVAVGDEVVEARRGIVVATGSHVSVPPIPGLDQVEYWTNREAIEAEALPGSIVVLGGGPVGVELAQVFGRFGVEVTIVVRSDRMLRHEEPEVGTVLADVFAREGITVRTDAAVAAVRPHDRGIAVDLDGGGTVHGERLLVATGRQVDLAAVGLGVVGVDESRSSVPVDDHLRVADGVWAVGDVTGEGPFTHVAMYQASIAAADILGEDHRPADYRAVPRVTFTDPEIGAVGLTEAQAREAGIEVAAGRIPMPDVTRGWIHGDGNDGFIKVVADAERSVLVGATAAGPNGGEVVGLLSLAVHAAVPLATLRSMIYAYPTLHRGIEGALADLEA